MSEDSFEPSFPEYDSYADDLLYGSPLDEDDVPLNLELSSVPHSQRANRKREPEWNGVLHFNHNYINDGDERPLDLGNSLIEDDDDQLLDLENSLLHDYPKANQFARFYANFPWVISGIALLLAVSATVVSYKCYQLTDILTIDDPTAGFEARGTDTSGKSKTAAALYYSGFDRQDDSDIYSYKANISLIRDQLGLNISNQFFNIFGRKKRSLQQKFRGQSNIYGRSKRSISTSDGYADYSNCSDRLTSLMRDGTIENEMQFVFKSKKDGNLFTAEAMHSICKLEDKLVRNYWKYKYWDPSTPCRQASLPLYITVLSGKKSCYDITEDDMNSFKERLLECWSFFTNSTLVYYRQDQKCNKYRSLYNVFYYLTDKGFISDKKPDIGKLTYALLLVTNSGIETDASSVATYYISYLDKTDTDTDSVELAGFFYSMDMKFDLFDDYLMGDLWLFGLAMGIILFIMLIYLLSVTLVLATLLNVGMSFITAYCLYHLIFGIKFFPFINLLAGLILIAIGADDVFIFFDTWDQIKKQDKNIPLDVLVAKTFNHATLSVFVTSLTTSAAFFANSVSSIVALKCFGIFAGIAVLANFFFMITWTPAVIIIMEKYRRWNRSAVAMLIGTSLIMIPFVMARFLDFVIEISCGLCTLKSELGKKSNFIFGKLFPKIIEKTWALWLLLFLGLGIGGMVVVFYSPKLKLPHSKNIQLFPDSQFIEQWDQKLRTNFRYVIDADNKKQESIKIQFVWGVKAEDNGNLFDPNAQNTLVQDTSFNITSKAAQKWMTDFCNDLKKQSFLDPMYVTHSNAFPCMFPYFESLLGNSSSADPRIQKVLWVCVLQHPDNYIESCLPILSNLELVAQSGLMPYILGEILFDSKNNKPTALLMEVRTNKPFTTNYDEMQKYKDTFEDYFNGWLDSAPPELENGFLTSQSFYFYDLQYSIAHGTYYSIILSLSVAFVVMFVTSLNVLITAYALITISLTIAATVASLVLMGWELNIIESVTISLAVGLSIDFSIHYGVAYRLSKDKYPKGRVQESFERVGSAVVMAALTTLLAGSAMLPSHIMGYKKLGIFLVLVMTFSWLFATFFFQSLCRLAGPKGNFCQIRLPCLRKKRSLENTELENHNGSSTLILRSDSEASLLVTF